jgi:hypothetical protein
VFVTSQRRERKKGRAAARDDANLEILKTKAKLSAPI